MKASKKKHYSEQEKLDVLILAMPRRKDVKPLVQIIDSYTFQELTALSKIIAQFAIGK